MPIAGVGFGEYPYKTVSREAGIYSTVVDYVQFVIQGNKLMIVDLPVDRKRDQCQADRNQNNAQFAWCFSHLFWKQF